MNIVNLTPHPLTLVREDGSVVTLPKSETPARREQTREILESVAGFKVSRPQFGHVVDLPEQRADTIYIVSALVATACPDRTDVFTPGELIRDEQGRVVGAEGLSKPAIDVTP